VSGELEKETHRQARGNKSVKKGSWGREEEERWSFATEWQTAIK